MVKITWTENALLDIEEIASFIEKDSFKAAQKQVLKFFAVEESLNSHIKVGRTVPEFLSEDVREIIVDNY
ncbi:type II toxin-antitoxin system RelE/ParE family toxin [Litoribacter alkaliphilus]|uniref:Type II toxin-antitoxin system RelE/ParE family toxin n=1 Tax=Litoribacter ruber TaxID=702568 RepID=A0AAP2CK77_9BACT|nr:type II toxin-antitoxin system RelE/ParE family toxin [Litoribacter alkaliphilus]MBS9525475.1 type II toxin-antitoxin system RelE/ParE family toxin [Litoribacter alkaliphilus]